MGAYYRQSSGLGGAENFLMQDMPEDWLYYPEFLNVSQVRKAIHVGDTFYYDISNHSILVDDIPVPSTGTLQNLLNEGTYRVLLYHGQLDVVVPYTETAKMVSKLTWRGARNFRCVGIYLLLWNIFHA